MRCRSSRRFINDNKIIADDRLDLVGAWRWRSTSSRSARRSSIWWRFPAPTTPPARTARATRFRQCFYGETAANAIGPVLVKAFGKNRKAAFMTPDYTYGHTVTKSVNDYLSAERRLDAW